MSKLDKLNIFLDDVLYALLIIPFKLLFLGASALAWVVLIGGLLVWGLGE